LKEEKFKADIGP